VDYDLAAGGQPCGQAMGVPMAWPQRPPTNLYFNLIKIKINILNCKLKLKLKKKKKYSYQPEARPAERPPTTPEPPAHNNADTHANTHRHQHSRTAHYHEGSLINAKRLEKRLKAYVWLIYKLSFGRKFFGRTIFQPKDIFWFQPERPKEYCPDGKNPSD
jgi:hypothetical protein